MNKLSKILFVISILLLCLTGGLLFFKIALTSDTLFLDDLATNLFAKGGGWFDWRLSPAPAIVPDMLLYFVAYPLFKAAEYRIFFVSCAQVFGLAFMSIWLTKIIIAKADLNLQTLIVLIVCFVTLVAANSGMWLYFYTTNNHYPALLLGIASLGLWLKSLRQKSVLNDFAFVVTNVSGLISTAVFNISFFIPTFVFMLCAIYLLDSNSAYNIKLKKSFKDSLALMCFSFLIYVLLKAIFIKHDPLAGRLHLSVGSIANSFSLFVRATSQAFDISNKYTFIMSFFVLLAITYLIVCFFVRTKLSNFKDSRYSKKLNYNFNACVAFLLILIGVNFTGSIFSGGFADLAGYRYFAFPICLLLILAVVMSNVNLKNQRYLQFFNLIFALIIFASSLYFLTHHYNSRKMFNPQSSCLDDLKNKGLALGEGLGDYWNARAVTYSSASKLPIIPVLNDLTPFFWMSSIAPILKNLDYSANNINFILIRKPQTSDPFAFTAENLGLFLPKPTAIYDCYDSDSEVWFYENTNLQQTFNSLGSKFLFSEGLKDSLYINASFLPGTIGKNENLSRYVDHNHSKGHLVYGPYVNIKKGSYKVTLKYHSLSTETTNAFVYMGRFNSKSENTLIYKSDLPVLSDGVNTSIINVDKKINDFEVRVWYNGNGTLKVDSIHIEKIN